MQSETKLTPTQLEIMNLFWEHGELGVAQVRQLLKIAAPKRIILLAIPFRPC